MALTRPKYSQIYDTDWKQSVELATTGSDIGNLKLGNTQPNNLDTISTAIGMRILVKDQTDASQNGIYTVRTLGAGSNGWWERSLDSNQNSFVTAGLTVTVAQGTINGGQEWRLVTPDPITLGTTALAFRNQTGTPGGANTYVQFNDTTVLGGSPAFKFDKVSNTVVISNAIQVSNVQTTTANIQSTTTSTNTATGAVRVMGGVGVAGSVYATTVYGNIGGGSVLPNIYVTGSIIPTANITYDLGTPTARFRTGYFSANTIDLGGSQISVDPTNGFSFKAHGAPTPITIASNGAMTSNTMTAPTVTFTSTQISTHSTQGAVVVVGGVGISGNLHVSSNVAIGNNLNVTGNIVAANVTFNAITATTLNVAGGGLNAVAIGQSTAAAGSFTTLSASASTYANSTTQSTSTTTGAVIVAGGLGVAKDVFFGNSLNVVGNIVAGNVTFNAVTASTLDVAGGGLNAVAIGQSTAAAGAFTSLTSNGMLWANANATVGGNLVVSSPLNSVPYVMGSGAFHVAGGMSIGKDVWIGGQLYVANIVSQSTTTLAVTAPLVYLTASNAYPYNYAIGMYSHYVGGPANTYGHTGMVRNEGTNSWYLFSNVPEPEGSNVNVFSSNTNWDTLHLGNAIVHGNAVVYGNVIAGGYINSTGNILSTGATLNSLTVNGTTTSTGFINTSANISAAQVNSGTSVVSGTGYIGEVFVTSRAGDEGGQLNLAPAVTNNALTGNITIDIWQNRLRIFESGGTNRGGYFDISGLATGVGTNLAGGGGGVPGGGPNQMQFNQAASFAGAASLYYYGANGAVVSNAGIASTSTTTGSFQIGGGIGVTGAVVAGQLNTPGNVLATAGIFNALTVNGNESVTGYLNVTGNILSTGAIHNSLTVNGSITSTGYFNTTSNISASAINAATITGTHAGVASFTSGTLTGITALTPSGNATTSLGSLANQWSTIYGRATTAQYADLAEIYTSDKKYVPGTVVIFGGSKEVTISELSHDTRIAGVISTNPAYLMNSTETGVEVALTGRVPCRVKGPIAKGDRVVASDLPGVAYKMDKTLYEPGCIIGKSLEDIIDDRVHTIEVVVGRI